MLSLALKKSCSKLLWLNTKTAPILRKMSTITVDLGNAFKSHLCEVPSTTVTATKDELVDYLKIMYTMRRMEITCDTEYKVRDYHFDISKQFILMINVLMCKGSQYSWFLSFI